MPFNLPPRLARLGELANNLWWTWNPGARQLFETIDPVTWERVNHNPVKLLHELSADKLQAASADVNYLTRFDATIKALDAYLQSRSTWYNAAHPELRERPIAYFSAEFGLHESLPIYSGGLGILSGDHTKEASDLGLPFVGIGFLYPQGYFEQRINGDGWQDAIYEKLNFDYVPAVAAKDEAGKEIMIEVELHGRMVYAKVWRFQVGGVPLFLMDTDVELNASNDRELAARLYGGDHEIRIAQEIVLGIGGVRALRALGYRPRAWHLNEGHSAFSVLERTRELVQSGTPFDRALQAVRASTLFTTHTPVAAGNDAFGYDLMDRYFANFAPQLGMSTQQLFDLARQDSVFSMTVLALKFSGAANGVSQLHGEVARKMWHFVWNDRAENDVPIGSVTNGVHTLSWLAPEFHSLFDEYFVADWRERIDDPTLWEEIEKIPDDQIWSIQCALKHKLLNFLGQRTSQARPAHAPQLNPDALTLGFARRFATYKRAALIFRDDERLRRILNQTNRPVQILFSGKAHPADDPGKSFIQQVVQHSREQGLAGRIVFIEDYDINVARYLVQGVDVWLNNPRRPLEACGTSGQKASLNGIPNLSVLDGWWREGFIRGVNGWAIGADQAWDDADAQDANDAESFYAALENEVVPLFYQRDADRIPHAWVRKMKAAIKTIAPRFSTRRMVKEYVEKYYVPAVINK
jgi:glycogen phosphorylase